MLENTPTRGTKKPPAAARKAASKVAEAIAPVGGNGEVLTGQADNPANPVDPIRDLVTVLAENIRHNTELLRQIDQRRAEQTGDRAPVVEQLRTILDYKAIGQMAGRSGTPFQDNLIGARRFDAGGDDALTLFVDPSGVAKVSVQVDGDDNPEVFESFTISGNSLSVVLDATRGRNIGRIEVLNSQGQPIRLGPRMVATTQD